MITPRLLLTGISFLLALSAVAEVKPRVVHSRQEATRDHHLFVGADLFVYRDGEMKHVKKMRGDSVLIENPDPDYLPLSRTRGLTYQMNTKVSATIAQIDSLEAHKTYAPNMEAMLEQAKLQIFLSQQADIMAAEQNALQSEINEASALAQSGETDEIRTEASVLEGNLMGEMSDLQSTMGNFSDIAEATQLEPEGFGDQAGQEDAVEVTFKVSSDREISDAYVFVVVRILGDTGYEELSFHEHIGRVTTKPRLVSVMQPGFEPGFDIKETRVYLYSNGEEIPTNTSDKHYGLTKEEAHEFLLLSHMGDNRRQSIPAKPAWELAPPALIAAKDRGSLAYTVRVELDAQGRLVEIKKDNQIVPDHVLELVQQLTFLPALQNGEPVPSSLTVNLADYFKDA